MTTLKNTVIVNGETSVVTVKTQGPQGPAFADGDIGDIVISGGGTIATIDNGVINNAKIASNAAIALSKLATGALPTGITVTSANISDLSIVDADINASASIQGTKISPNFGSQSIISSLDGNQVTQGNAALTLTHATNTNLRANHLIVDDFPSGNGTYFIQVTESGVSNDRNMCLQGYGGKLKIGSNSVAPTELLDVAGNIAVSGTVDGRDVAADGTKLDTVETNAKDDQTAAEIKTLLNSDGIVNAQIDASAAIAGSKIAPSFVNDITITNATPTINFVDTNQNSDFQINVEGGKFTITDTTNNATRLKIQSGGLFHIQSTNTKCTNLEAEGNITVDGTVDGRDVAADGTKLDGIEANAINASNTAITNKLPLAGGTITGNLTVGGNFTVNGTTTTIDTTTLTVEDKNIELGKVSTPTDTTADGGGLTLKGATDKTFQWLDATDSWTSSEHIALPDSKKLQLGASQDLFLEHNGSDSYITSNTGNFIIQHSNNSGDLEIKANDFYVKSYANEKYIRAQADGAVELYHNDVKKFETSSAGATVTGDLSVTGHIDVADNVRLRLGTGDDLQIYHGGTNSQIINSTGILNIRGNDVRLQVEAGNEEYIKCVQNGAVELYHDNSKKFETTSTGVQVTGNVNIPQANNLTTGSVITTSSTALTAVDNGVAVFGTDLDLRIYHDGSNSYIQDAGTGDLLVNTSQMRIKNAANNETMAIFTENGKVQLWYDNSAKLETTSVGVTVKDVLSITDSAGGQRLLMGNQDSAGVDCPRIFNVGNAILTIGTGDSWSGDGGTLTEQFKILKDGTVQLPIDNQKLEIGAGQDLQLYHSGSSSYITNSTGYLFIHGNDIALRSVAQENYIVCDSNAEVELYYDGSKKFETTSTGTLTTGQSKVDVNTSLNGNTDYNGQNFGFLVSYDGGDDTNDEGNGICFAQQYSTGDTSTVRTGAIVGYKSVGNGSFGGGLQFKVQQSGATPLLVALKMDHQGTLYMPQDNQALKIGASQDLQLVHTGTYSNIYNATGDLDISSNVTRLKNGNRTENFAAFINNGQAELYYDNVKRFETTSVGATVSGNLTIESTSPTIFLTDTDNNSDFRINNSNGLFEIRDITNTTTRFSIKSDGKVGIGTVQQTTPLELAYSDANASDFTTSASLHDGTNVNLIAGMFKNSGSGNSEVGLLFESGDTQFVQWSINAIKTGSFIGDLAFRTRTGGQTAAERMRIDSSGNVKIPNDNAKLQIGASQDLELYHNGSNNSSFIDNTTGDLTIRGGGGDIIINPVNTETAIYAIANNKVQLRYDNSTKLETTSGGISVVGQVDLTRQNTANEGGEIAFRRANDNTKQWYIDVFGSDNNARLRFHSETVHTSGRTYAELTHDEFKVLEGTDLNVSSDSGKLLLGASSDLQIYHDGSNSYIKDAGTGSLILESNHLITKSAAYSFQNGNNTESLIYAVENGKVELFFDSSSKFETTSIGATVTGNLQNNGQIIANLQADISTQGNPALIITSSTNTNMRANFLMEDDYTSGRGALMIQVTESGVSNDRDLILMGFGGKTGVGGTPTADFHVHGNSAFNGTIGVGVTSPAGNNKLHLRLADSSIATPSTASVLLAENSGNSWITIGSGASSYGGILFGDSGQSDRGQVRFNHNGDIMQMIANEEKLFQATLNNTAELYFDNGVKLKTNTAGVIVQNDVYLNNGNSNVFFNSDGSSFYGSSPAIGRAGSDNFHITGSEAGDLVIAAEYGERIIFGLTTNTSGAPTIKMTMNPDGHINIPNDNAKLQIGAGQDLKLFHNGSHSTISSSTGSLRHLANTNYFADAALSEVQAQFIQNGKCELRFDNGVKLETTTNGITVTGSVTTQDMNMSNLNGSANEVDNTKGSWSIQEGSDDLFIINRVTGKKYKFNLTEIS